MLQGKEFSNSGDFKHFGKSVGERFSTSMILFGSGKSKSFWADLQVGSWIWAYFKNCCLFLISAMMWGAMNKHGLNLSYQ